MIVVVVGGGGGGNGGGVGGGVLTVLSNTNDFSTDLFEPNRTLTGTRVELGERTIKGYTP